MIYEGFRLRWTEVDRDRPKSRKYLVHFLDVLMDLEAQTSSELRSFMLYRSIWVLGADFNKIVDLLTEEGSTFYDFSSEQNRLRYRCFRPSVT